MYYLKNTNTNIIRTFQDNESPIDPKNWISSTQEEYLSQAPSNEMKQAKIYQLNKNREEYCLIPVEYNSNTYATTLEAKASIIGILSLLPNLSSTADYYNYPEQEKVTLTKVDFKAIADKIQTREIASRDKRELKKTEINNASSIEELNSINIEFN